MGTCIYVKISNKQKVLPKTGKFATTTDIKAKNTSVMNTIWIMPSEYEDKIEKLKMGKLSPLNLNLSELYCRRRSNYDLRYAARVQKLIFKGKNSIS